MSDLEHDAYVYPGQRIARNGHVLGHGQGMTLRDWFAGQALAGMMANCDTTGLNAWPAVYAAKYAFEVADAMFAARQGGDA